MNVYSSFIHNHPKLEITKISFNRWMDKWTVVPSVEYYSAVKMNEPSSHEKTWRNAYYEVKEASLTMVPTIWFHYMTFWKWHKGKKAVKGSLVLGGEEEGMEDEKRGDHINWQRRGSLSIHCPSFLFNRIIIGQIIPQNKDSNSQPPLQLIVPQDSTLANGSWEEVMCAPLKGRGTLSFSDFFLLANPNGETVTGHRGSCRQAMGATTAKKELGSLMFLCQRIPLA